MISTKFNSIIEADTLHGSFALKGKNLGQIQLWAFNKCYLFLDFMTGKVHKISLDKINRIKVIPEADFRRRWSDTKGEYQKNMVDVSSTSFTNKLWSGDFISKMSNVITDYYFYLEIIARFGSLTEARKNHYVDFENVFKRYYLSPDSVSFQKFIELGEFKITEEQIVNYLKNVYTLPIQYSREIIKKVKKSKEVKYYLQLI